MVNFSNVIDTELPVETYHLYDLPFDIDDIALEINWILKYEFRNKDSIITRVND